MTKPLPEHLTRAEAAEVLRLSLRQVDRLAEAGKLKKVPLSASRRGFERESFDRYLQSLGNDGGGYMSTVGSFSFSLPPESSLTCNQVAARLDEILAMRLPGCLVNAADGAIHVIWHAALEYSVERILKALK